MASNDNDQKMGSAVNLDDILPADDMLGDWGDNDAAAQGGNNPDGIDLDDLIFGGGKKDEQKNESASPAPDPFADDLGDFFDNLTGQKQQQEIKPVKEIENEPEESKQNMDELMPPPEVQKDTQASASNMIGSMFSYLSQEIKHASTVVAQNTTNIASTVAGNKTVSNLGASLNAVVNAGMGVDEADEDRIFDEDWKELQEKVKQSKKPQKDNLIESVKEAPVFAELDEAIDDNDLHAEHMSDKDENEDAAPSQGDSNFYANLFSGQPRQPSKTQVAAPAPTTQKKDEGNFMEFLTRATSLNAAVQKIVPKQNNVQQDENDELKKQKRPFVFKDQGKKLDVFSSIDVMNGKVMQHLVNENKKLRLMLAKQRQSEEHKPVEVVDENLLQELESKNEDFDAEAEFNYLQTQYDLHNARPDEDEATALYAACFYTKDFAEIAQQKIELYKRIARRALVNQQLILQSSSKKVLGKDSVLSAIKNTYLKLENKRLKASNKEQEDQLKNKAEENERLRAYYGEKISTLRQAISQVSGKLADLKEYHLDEMVNVSQQMQQLKSANVQQNNKIVNILAQHARKQKQSKEEMDSMILSKNGEISKQFMQIKQLKDDHQKALESTRADLKESHDEAMSKIIFQKNNEINKMHTEQMATRSELEALQRDHEEAVEMQQRLQEESVALKEQFRSSIDEVEQLKSAKQDEETAHEDTRNQLALFTSKLTELQQTMIDKENELNDLHAQLEGKNDEITQIEEEIDQYAENLQQREEHIQRLEAETAQLKIELSSSNLLQQRIQELEQANARLTQENDVLQANQAIAQLQQTVPQPTPKLQMPLLDLASIEVKREPVASVSQNSQQPSKQDETTEKQVPQNEQMHLDLQDWGGMPDEDDPLGFLNDGVLISQEPIKSSDLDNLKAEQQSDLEDADEGDFGLTRMQTAMNDQLLGQLIFQAESHDEVQVKQVGEQIDQTINKERMLKEQTADELDEFLLGDDPLEAVVEVKKEESQPVPEAPPATQPSKQQSKKNRKRNKRGKQKSVSMNTADLSKLKQSGNFSEHAKEVSDQEQMGKPEGDDGGTANLSVQDDLDVMNEEEGLAQLRKSQSTPDRNAAVSVAELFDGDKDISIGELSPSKRRSVLEVYGSLSEKQQKDRLLLDLKHQSLENLPTPRTIERFLKSVRDVKIEDMADDDAIEGAEPALEEKNNKSQIMPVTRDDQDPDGDFHSSLFPDSFKQGQKDGSLIVGDDMMLTMGSNELEQLLSTAPAAGGHHRVSELINEGDAEEETSDREVLAQRLRDQLERSDVQQCGPFQEAADALVDDIVTMPQNTNNNGENQGTPEQLLSDLEEELEIVPDKSGEEDDARPAAQFSHQRGKSIEIIPEENCEEEEDEAAEDKSKSEKEEEEEEEQPKEQEEPEDSKGGEQSPMALQFDDELALGLEDPWGGVPELEEDNNRVSLPDVDAIAEEERRISPEKPEDEIVGEYKVKEESSASGLVEQVTATAAKAPNVHEYIEAAVADAVIDQKDDDELDGKEDEVPQEPAAVNEEPESTPEQVVEEVEDSAKTTTMELAVEVPQEPQPEQKKEKKLDLTIKALLPENANPAILMVDEDEDGDFMRAKELDRRMLETVRVRTKNPLQKTYEYPRHGEGEAGEEDTLELASSDKTKAVIVPTHQFSKSFSSSLQSGPAATGAHTQIMAATKTRKQTDKSESQPTITKDGGSSDPVMHGDEESLEEIGHSYKESEFYSPLKLRSLANDQNSMISREESSIAGTLSPRKLNKALKDLALPQIDQESPEPVEVEEIADISDKMDAAAPHHESEEKEQQPSGPEPAVTNEPPVFAELEGLDMDEPMIDDQVNVEAEQQPIMKEAAPIVFDELEGLDDGMMMGFDDQDTKTATAPPVAPSQEVEPEARKETKPSLDFDFAELDNDDLAFADEGVADLMDTPAVDTKSKKQQELSLDDLFGAPSEPAKAAPTSDAAAAFLAELSEKYSSHHGSERTPEKVPKQQDEKAQPSVDPFEGVVDIDDLAIDMDGFAPFEAEEEKQPVSARIEHDHDENEADMLPVDDDGDLAFDALFDSTNNELTKNKEAVQAVSDAQKDIMALAESATTKTKEQPDLADDC